jgi:hypothetical protein
MRERAATAHLPADYRAIPGLKQITRGDLAALVGVRLQAIGAANRQVSSAVATDVRGHWAAAWIMGAIRAGLMDVYANHTFQPRAIVRRVELAQVVSRVLGAAGRLPSRSVRPPIADVGSDHLNYTDISVAVASGVMPLDEGLFRPSRPVSGQEATDAVQRLERQVARVQRGSR